MIRSIRLFLRLSIALMLVLLSSCSTIKVNLQNNPLAGGKPIGNRVKVEVFDMYTNLLNNTLADKITYEAQQWLISKGYNITDISEKADILLGFTPAQEEKMVHIQGSSGSKTAGIINTMLSSPTKADILTGRTPTDHSQALQNAYYSPTFDATVTYQRLYLQAMKQEYGKKMVQLLHGFAYYDDKDAWDQMIFDSEKKISSAVRDLLDKSILNSEK